MVSRATPAWKKSGRKSAITSEPGPAQPGTAQPGPIELGTATWPTIAGRTESVLLVPVGSCEQHGPHLPLDTDTRIATAVAAAVAAGRDDVLVAPAVAYGASGEHQDFAGTLSIGTEALITLLVELGRSAFPPARPRHRSLLFVNSHGGNLWAVDRAVEVLAGEGRPVASWSPRIAGGDAHAGRTETSLILAIAPETVGESRPAGNTTPVQDLFEMMRTGGVAAVSPNGVLGDPAGASAAEGSTIFRRLVDDLSARIDQAGKIS